jgi:tripartite ATP-independent transporter DctM subunit
VPVAFLFAAMLALIALGAPIAAAIGAAATLTLVLFYNVNLEIVASRLFYGLDSFLILAVPLFLLLGEVMERARITERLVTFADALVGHWRGGMGHVAVVSNVFLSGVSGSGAADAAATGVALVPAMTRSGYRPAVAAALIAASSTVGPIIPPSIIMVIYASITGVSVAQLFLAGFVPGFVIAASLMVWVYFHAPRSAASAPTTRPQRLPALRRASLVLAAPLIVVVGIVGGVFTATESAAIACAYAFVLGLVVYRTLAAGELLDVFRAATANSARVMFVVASSSIFSWVMVRAGVGEYVGSLPMFAPDAPAWVILLSINVLLLVLGCFMDAVAVLLIVAPIMLPIAMRAGIDPVHLGIVMSVNLSIGLVTPPFGTSMFVLLGIAKVNMIEFTRAAWPLIVVLVAALGVITYVPAASLALPRLVAP